MFQGMYMDQEFELRQTHNTFYSKIVTYQDLVNMFGSLIADQIMLNENTIYYIVPV